MIKLFIVVYFLFSFVFCSQKDPYLTLGVSRTATTEQIRRSYKQLAREWHPDKNPNPEAEKRFVDINQAYEVLSDPEKRKKFDRYGSYEATEMPEGGGGQNNPFTNFHFGSFGNFQFNFHSEPTFFSKHRITIR